MLRSPFYKIVATLAVLASSVSAAAALDIGDKRDLCISCHGETGNPEMPGVPALAGRPVAELTKQLKLFRSGERQNRQMVMAKHLTDDEIKALAAYFSKQDRH